MCLNLLNDRRFCTFVGGILHTKASDAENFGDNNNV